MARRALAAALGWDEATLGDYEQGYAPAGRPKVGAAKQGLRGAFLAKSKHRKAKAANGDCGERPPLIA